MGRAYKLYTNATGSNNGVASIKITKSARLRTIYFDLSATGGVGVSRTTVEVSKQNTSSLTINDTPETVLAQASLAHNNAVPGSEAVQIFCDISVSVGDTIYLNTAMIGAVAPASVSFSVYLYV